MYQKSHISHGIEIQKFQETFHLKFEILIKEKRKNEEEIMKEKNKKNSKDEEKNILWILRYTYYQRECMQ